MDHYTARQIRGANDLVLATIDATVVAIEDAHQAIAQRPYAVLAQIGVIAGPVRAIEQVQQTITGGVYGSIRVITQMVGIATTCVCNRLEEYANRGPD